MVSYWLSAVSFVRTLMTRRHRIPQAVWSLLARSSRPCRVGSRRPSSPHRTIGSLLLPSSSDGCRGHTTESGGCIRKQQKRRALVVSARIHWHTYRNRFVEAPCSLTESQKIDLSAPITRD